MFVVSVCIHTTKPFTMTLVLHIMRYLLEKKVSCTISEKEEKSSSRHETTQELGKNRENSYMRAPTEMRRASSAQCARAWLPARGEPRAYLAGERDVRRGDLQDAGVGRHPGVHRQALAPRHRLAVVRQRVHPRPREQRRRCPRRRRRRQVRCLRPRRRLHHSKSATLFFLSLFFWYFFLANVVEWK
jgi:hypothetical protein